MAGTYGLREVRRRPIKAPVNPKDKSTIISIFPKHIIEFKYTIVPGRFEIEAGTYDNPKLLVVGPSSWWREFDEEQPLLEITNHSLQIADSVVRDYCNGVIGYSPDDASPGLFYLNGEFTINEARKDYRSSFERAREMQDKWFKALIKMADSLWARSNGNPLAISDDMRMAAVQTGQTVKDWMKDFRMNEMVRCLACGNLKNPEYPVCSTCHSIDTSHPKAKDIKFSNQ